MNPVQIDTTQCKCSYGVGSPEAPEQVALDSAHVKAHRCAGGGKGGPRNRRSASPRAAETVRFTGLSTNYAARGS
jgi:hypothetical protein